MDIFVDDCQTAVIQSKLDADCPSANRLACSIKGTSEPHYCCVRREVQQGEQESCLPAVFRSGGLRHTTQH